MKNEKIISQLSLEQKAKLLAGKDFWQTVNIDELGIPSIFLADGPNGLRKQKAAADHLGLNESIKSTCFPTSATIANSWNPLIVETFSSMLGVEAVAERVSVVLGPGVNIKRNPLAGRNFEYYSEDPYLAGKISAAFIRGVQSNGIATTVKHFAANNQEYRRMSSDSVVDERALRELYLTPFEISVKEGQSKAIMASYNLVNGVYANENSHLLNDILRKEWGFDGVIVSDWGGLNDKVASIKATAELEMPTSGGQTTLELIEAVKDGKVSQEELDQAVDRVLTLVFDTHKAFENKPVTFNKELHHSIAQKAAEESIVLLKNEENILPIKPKDKVAIIGDFAKEQRFQGAGSSGVNPTQVDTILDSISDNDFNYVGFSKGFHRYGRKSKRLLNQAKKLAIKADVVLLFLGLDEYSETEGLDRKTLMLPQNQLTLLEHLHEVNKNIVVVLSCGSVIDTSFDRLAKGLLHTYLPGQAGAKATLNILTGKVSPSGKLSETYPVSYEQVPSSPYFPGKQNTVEYRESIFVGYRYFDKARISVKYPFGHGLTYSKFNLSELVVDDHKVSFKIKNIGNCEAQEVAQLYIGKSNTKILRPTKELKGFIKVALKPNEEREVSIPFDEYSFRFYNAKSKQFEVEPGDYEIYIGTSSEDISLKRKIIQKGNMTTLPYTLDELKAYKEMNILNIPNKEFKTLLGRDIPKAEFVFYKKKRMVVDYNTTVQQLKYSRGWSGRFFAFGVRFGHGFLRLIGQKKTANMMQMALYHNPMRNISRLTGGMITWKQLDGLILMFNGHFFKGVKQFIKGRNKKQKKEGRS
ncbi:beta-glucosidase [Acholeplasma morum]|uniref:glycoside hydrolase family 3 C-terminal domain-containing protein n=1 Tax=Paracholeplasma morum TaxID=264637 RepID=UPI001956F1A3|nr:glycoside hydrolase family 3 C-terminal domain-containing protein [Paracholeplasma morum]MBM7453006.1 beta-glucosidase [Paracholeplasma morum]